MRPERDRTAMIYLDRKPYLDRKDWHIVEHHQVEVMPTPTSTNEFENSGAHQYLSRNQLSSKC